MFVLSDKGAHKIGISLVNLRSLFPPHFDPSSKPPLCSSIVVPRHVAFHPSIDIKLTIPGTVRTSKKIIMETGVVPSFIHHHARSSYSFTGFGYPFSIKVGHLKDCMKPFVWISVYCCVLVVSLVQSRFVSSRCSFPPLANALKGQSIRQCFHTCCARIVCAFGLAWAAIRTVT